MKKIKVKKWSLIRGIFQILFGAIAVLWLFGLFIQFIHSAITQDYSMFKEYGMVALTVFGFTLIGGIFENRKKHPEIVKKLFDSSLLFLMTAIAFYFMYSMSPVFTRELVDMGELQTVIIVGASTIAIMVSFYGIIFGLLDLYRILVDYRLTLEKVK